MTVTSQTSLVNAFPSLPPYPEDSEAKQSEVLTFDELEPSKSQSLDESAGPAAPGDTIAVTAKVYAPPHLLPISPYPLGCQQNHLISNAPATTLLLCPPQRLRGDNPLEELLHIQDWLSH